MPQSVSCSCVPVERAGVRLAAPLGATGQGQAAELTGPLDEPPGAGLALPAGELAAVFIEAVAEAARLAAAGDVAGG